MFHDFLIFFLQYLNIQVLPGKSTICEIYKHIANRFKVVSARLFNTKMGIDRCIAGCSRKVFILFILNMLMCFGVTVPLGETEIDNVYNMRFLAEAHEEILWLNIPMYEVLGMKTRNCTELNNLIFQYFYHLMANH